MTSQALAAWQLQVRLTSHVLQNCVLEMLTAYCNEEGLVQFLNTMLLLCKPHRAHGVHFLSYIREMRHIRVLYRRRPGLEDLLKGLWDSVFRLCLSICAECSSFV